MNVTFNTSLGFEVILNGKTYYKYLLKEKCPGTTFELDTQYGFCKINGNLAESLDYIEPNITNLGAMRIPSGESQIFISQPLYWSATTGFLQIDNSNRSISYTPEEVAKGNLYVIVQDGSYGNESTPGLPGPSSTVIWGDDENLVYAAATRRSRW